MTCSYLICHALFCCHYELFKFHINPFWCLLNRWCYTKKKGKSIIVTFSSQKYSNSYTFILSKIKSMSFVLKNLTSETKLFISCKLSLQSRAWNQLEEGFSERRLLNFKNVCQLRHIRNLFTVVLSIPFLYTKHYWQIVAVIAKRCR